MKELLRIFKEACEKATAAESAYENNPEDIELENAFDEAYKEEFKARENLANEIVAFTNKQIDFNAAFRMISNPKLEELIEKLA